MNCTSDPFCIPLARALAIPWPSLAHWGKHNAIGHEEKATTTSA